MLTEKLDLNAEQQERARPILDEMQSGLARIFDDKSLTHEEAFSRMLPVYSKADERMRVFLTDDQKKKLDDLERQSHLDLHPNPGGSTAPRH